MNVSYSQPMLGEHPSSLTELHAQKHQVNPRIHLSVPVSPQHPMHVFVFLHCFFFFFTCSWIRLCWFPSESLIISFWIFRCQQRLLPVWGAEGDHLLRGGHFDIPEWVSAPFSDRALPRAAAAQHGLPATEGAVLPTGENRNVICSKDETERSVCLFRVQT